MFRVLATFGLVIACCNSASAGMIFTTVGRGASAGSNSAFSPTTGVFNQIIHSPSLRSTATQNTNFTTSSLSGSGSVFRAVTTTDTAYSGFFVDFDLLQPHTFTLTSHLNAFSPGTAGLGLTANTGSITPDGSPVVASVGAFSTSGLLGPGSYSFNLGADLVIPFASTGSASYEFSFEVEPVASVPEPASLVLVAMGVLGLPVVRRRKRR